MTWSNYSEMGSQLNSTLQNLDNPVPGAVFTQHHEQYHTTSAKARNPMCQPGQLCNRSYNVGFWSQGDMPSAEKNTQMQLGVTQLHSSYPASQMSSGSMLMRQEKAGSGCCPSNCCDKPASTPFWKVSPDHSMLDNYSRNDIVKCMGLSDGDENKFRALLSRCQPQ